MYDPVATVALRHAAMPDVVFPVGRGGRNGNSRENVKGMGKKDELQ